MNRNVVILCLDTVRKDYFEMVAKSITEKSDIVINGCRAASSWSVPSHASILTGTLPHQHEVHAHSTNFSRIDPADTFLEGLSVDSSVGLSANYFASSNYGFDAFFDRFHDVNPNVVYDNAWDDLNITEGVNNKHLHALKQALKSDYSTHKFIVNELKRRGKELLSTSPLPQLFDDGASQIAEEITTLAESSEGSFFAFANMMEAHQPHEHLLGFDGFHSVPNGWNSGTEFYEKKWAINRDGPEDHMTYLYRYRALYLASIKYLDEVISKMITTVDRATSRPTTYVITADHGENLGYPSESGFFEHTTSLSEGLLHVPLNIVNAPDGFERLTDYRYFSHLDLGALVVALHKEDPEFEPTQRPAAESIGISPGHDPLPSEEYEYWDRAIRAVYEDDRKYVWDSLGKRSVYALEEGRPSHQEELSERDRFSERYQELFERDLNKYKTGFEHGEMDGRDPVEQGSKERLRDLGYL